MEHGAPLVPRTAEETFSSADTETTEANSVNLLFSVQTPHDGNNSLLYISAKALACFLCHTHTHTADRFRFTLVENIPSLYELQTGTDLMRGNEKAASDDTTPQISARGASATILI